MNKNGIIRKLTSRKFWVAVAAFVSMIIIAQGGTEDTAVQVTALIMAGASVVGYILGEGLADSSGPVLGDIVEDDSTEDNLN